MATIQGSYVKWGIGIDGTNLGGTGGIALFNPQRVSLRSEKKKKEIADKEGITKTVVFYDEVKRLTLEIIPIGATADAAKANNKLLTIGSKVSITDASDADIAGDWIVDNMSKEQSADGEARITLELVKYEGITPS